MIYSYKKACAVGIVIDSIKALSFVCQLPPSMYIISIDVILTDLIVFCYTKHFQNDLLAMFSRVCTALCAYP